MTGRDVNQTFLPDATLMMKVVERVEVARSFARIAAGLLTASAAQKLPSVRVWQIARAAVPLFLLRDFGIVSGFVLRVSCFP